MNSRIREANAQKANPPALDRDAGRTKKKKEGDLRWGSTQKLRSKIRFQERNEGEGSTFLELLFGLSSRDGTA